MSTTQSDVMQLAQQGNPKAIAALMNRSLRSKGITVKAFVQKNRLNIFLESAEIPPQQSLVDLTQKGISSLNIETIKTVRVHGKQEGEDLPCWAEEFTLDTYIEPSVADSDAIVVASTTVHPIQQARSVSTTPRNITVASTKSANLPLIAIIVGVASVAGLALIGLFGSIFWVRSAQSSAIAESQELIKTVGEGENAGSIEALKADQENLQAAIGLLEDTPKLPVVNVGSLQSQLTEAESKLAEVEESIETYEALMPQILAVVDQFSALDSSLDVGMNYRDYGSEVREIKVVLDRLGREPGVADQAVYEDLKEAYIHYEFAYNVWNYYIESDSASNSFFPADSSYGRLLVNTYNVEPTDILSYKKIYLDTALSTVWSAASQKVEDALTKI